MVAVLIQENSRGMGVGGGGGRRGELGVEGILLS